MSEDLPPPNPPIRRIVTGHDAAGKAIVTMDAPAGNHKWPGDGRAAGIVSTLIWSTHESPAEMWTDEDFGARVIPTQPPAMGSRFCVIDFQPGNMAHMHRTDSLDYVLCLAGEIDMDMDESTVTMRAGDVLIQQATNHSWRNRGTETARIVFALIDGKPAPGGTLAIAEPMPPALGGTPRPDAEIRRIVTSHDQAGVAGVMWDGPALNQAHNERGITTTLFWGSDETPAKTWTREDFGARDNDIAPGARGSWFRVVDYPAGAPGRMHRTETVDYAICLAGSIDMELDIGTVPFRAGDVMVQQGTNHSWINNGTENCRIAFVLLDAKPKA